MADRDSQQDLTLRVADLEERIRVLEQARGVPATPPPEPIGPLDPLPELPPPTPYVRAPRPPLEPSRAPVQPRPRFELPEIQWERLLGVRGAAILAGIAFALAGLLFLQYTLSKGWITPTLRLVFAAFTGAAAVAGSKPLHRRGYRWAGNAMAGAGAVVLYGTSWAAHALYDLVGLEWSFAGMVASTSVTGALAHRRKSLVIATFGTLGGFLAPMLLALGGVQPLALFAYLTLINLGVGAFIRSSGRPELGYIGVLGSLAATSWWLFWLPEGASQAPALAFLVTSSLSLTHIDSKAVHLGLRTAALLAPLPYLAWFGAFELDLLPLALGTLVLTGAANWNGHRHGAEWLCHFGSAGAVVTLFAWCFSNALEGGGTQLLLVGTALAVAATAHRFQRPLSVVATHASLLTLLVLTAGRCGEGLSWAYAIGESLLAWLIIRAAARARFALPIYIAAGLVALGWMTQAHLAGHSETRELFVRPLLLLGLLTHALPRGLALGPQLLEIHGEARSWLRKHALAATSVAAAVLTIDLVPLVGFGQATVATHLLVALLTTATWVASAASGLGPLFGFMLLIGPPARWAINLPYLAGDAELSTLPPLLLQSALTAVGALIPTTILGKLPEHPLPKSSVAWVASALSVPMALPVIYPLWNGLSPSDNGYVLVLLLLLAGLAWLGRPPVDGRHGPLGAAAPARPPFPAAELSHWVAALALMGFALPLQLERGVLPVGCALAGLLTLRDGRRHGRIELHGVATAWLAASVLSVLLSTGLLLAQPGSTPINGWPVFHWVSWGWLVPSVALLVAARFIGPRHRLEEIAGVLGILGLFLWFNLEITNLFSTPPTLDFGHRPDQGLIRSMAWGLCSLALLALGIRRGSTALRWLSLAFSLSTLVKVFLFDLGFLTDLYRVASLLALALSLLAISLIYRRYVFREAPTAVTM